MSLNKIKQWNFISTYSSTSIFFILCLSLLSNTSIKASASEAKILLDELNNLEDSNIMSQVNNVDRLRDVSPTDWAYEALRSLVDRYGCIVGFPDRTYRDNKALSRYEFAAGLNSCLNQIERLLAASENYFMIFLSVKNSALWSGRELTGIVILITMLLLSSLQGLVAIIPVVEP